MRDTPVTESSLRLQWVVGRGAPHEGTNLGADVIAIFGPTASGKSVVARRVADALGTEVVSADALQVYRGLPILTNQPADSTLLVAIRDLPNPMSVGEYAALAHRAVDGLIEDRGAAVVAGGTGLYLRAALADLEIPPAVDRSNRARAESLYDEDRHAAHARLSELDRDAAAAVHVNDRRRVVRSLELAEAGLSLVPSSDRLWSGLTRRPTLVVGLDLCPDTLRDRIEARADDMIRRGAVAEARAAALSPISRSAEKALGLTELATLPLEEAREALVMRTQRYAAYQRKWMRRIPGIVLLDADRASEEVAGDVLDLARAR
ncbi:MAG TPA: isopentenyl transferase family protein [Gaiellaceae bacterium]|nr:isopentenyl transferase family protein [Gaiellaceae bacterium]